MGNVSGTLDRLKRSARPKIEEAEEESGPDGERRGKVTKIQDSRFETQCSKGTLSEHRR